MTHNESNEREAWLGWSSLFFGIVQTDRRKGAIHLQRTAQVETMMGDDSHEPT